jgi:cell division protein FtsQ
MLAIAIFSPILSLRTVTVEGANRVDPAAVESAVANQMGKPLALVDFDEITEELSTIALIRSYVTETVPPGTLVIHVTEREPVGVRENGEKWDLVDPAGIVVDSLDKRPDGVPVIKVGSAPPDSPAFTAAVGVLLSLSPELREKVRSVSASTADDVSFVFDGVGQRVVWGSAENSTTKATTLQLLMEKQKKGNKVEYNVSSPRTPFVRQL